MKWSRKQSRNFEDRRGTSNSRGKKTLLGGGVVGIIVLLLTIFGGEEGRQIGKIIEQVAPNPSVNTQTSTVRELSKEERTLGDFTEACFVYNNETWSKIFRESDISYVQPGMILFDNKVQTACGAGLSSTGPFYCPADKKVYMDLVFFNELHTRFGAKRGDFAIAYVIAHEIGHHIQNITGVNRKISQAQRGKTTAQANKLSVAQELQADFYAGIWANRNKNLLEAGDIDEAISAAEAVGDDTIQSRTTGIVQPERFTHGSAKQRREWFMKGYTTGNISLGDINKIYDSIRY